MGLKRNIELSAKLDSNGYSICVKINGASFDGHSNRAGRWKTIVQDIYGKLQSVYGERALFEHYVEYQDILSAMKVTGEIARSMDYLYMYGGREKQNETD